MHNPMRTTLTRSRRNVALIVSSASLALVGLGGGVAVALTAGGDGSHEKPPHLTDPTTPPPGQGTTPPGPGTTTPDPSTTAPDPGTTTPNPGTTTPDPGTTTPDPGTTTPNPGTTPGPGTETDPQANLPSVQSVCSGEAAGTLVGEPEEGTLDDGSKYLAYTFKIDGLPVTVLDVNEDQSFDAASIDTDGDGQDDVAALCDTDTDWQAA
jgi:hypothetical protein